jgi:predicted NBD/HSP70 family sugar kinase
MSNTEKLSFVQEKLAKGHEGAVKIWLTMGVYLGYAIAHYANYYDLKNVIILGRCTSGEGGRILLDEANKVLKAEFSDLGDRIRILLPDEKNRRVGQAIAAASLPNLSQKEFAR